MHLKSHENGWLTATRDWLENSHCNLFINNRYTYFYSRTKTMGTAPSKTFNPVNDLPSLKGKVAIVTGSRSGQNSILSNLKSELGN